MKLSICIPTFNRSKMVINQLLFIQNEFFGFENEIEIIVSDNCSNSLSKSELVKFSQGNTFFKLFLQEKNLGLIGNTEFLLTKSKSEYVWFVGDDDELEKGISKKIFEIFNKYNCLSYIFFNHNCFKNNILNVVDSFDLKKYSGYTKKGTEIMFDILNKYGTINMFMTANIYNRELLITKNKVLNRSLVIEDFLWFSFISSASGPIYIVSEVYVHDNYGGSSWSNSARKIFGIDIPNRLIEFDEFIHTNVDIRRVLFKYYIKGRGNFIYMILFASNIERASIVGFLGIKKSMVLIFRAFFLSLVRLFISIFKKHRI